MSESKKKTTPSEEEKVNIRRQPSKLDNARIRQILQDEEKLQKHLQPLFHAMLRGSPLQEEQQQEQQQQQQLKNIQKQRQKEADKLQRRPTAIQTQVPLNQTEPAATTTTTTAAPSIPIDDYIPHNPQEIRQTDLFSQLYRLIQFQRDQYLVGSEYATWQQNERQQQSKSTTTAGFGGWIIQADPNDRLPYDPMALGHQQLARVAADFIPTDTVRNATVPLLTPPIHSIHNWS